MTVQIVITKMLSLFINAYNCNIFYITFRALKSTFKHFLHRQLLASLKDFSSSGLDQNMCKMLVGNWSR